MDDIKEQECLDIIKSNVASYPDFPKPGILFWKVQEANIAPVSSSGDVFDKETQTENGIISNSQPTEGDIFTLLAKPDVFKTLKEVLINHVKILAPTVEAIVALESRGFLFGPLMALEFGIPFIPIRKKGKLPGKVLQETYSLEYGTDILEMQDNTIKPGQKILIFDDLIATGGSLNAACNLVQKVGGEIMECLVIMELQDLNGRKNIPFKVHSLIQF